MSTDPTPTARAGDPPATAGTPLLRVAGITKAFPGVTALDDVRLDLRHGEVLALVGENGAGKSTLMKLLSGIHQPDAGTMELDGEPLDVRSPRQANERGISIIHQEFHLMPDLSVAQNIFAGREPRRAGFIDDRALVRRATELFRRLEIPLDPRQPVAQLSVAGQQMVEIAKALSFDAKVLIMDEPTAALNDAEVRTLFRLIRGFVTPSTGVIYISHRMDEIKEISDRITVLRDGRYIDTLDTPGTDVQDVIARMVGREIRTDVRPAPAPEGRPVVLSVRGLSTRKLLKDVSFDLHEGEILGFAGLMGAGRTEVARALVGADRSTGHVEVRGRAIHVRNPADAVRHGIGYLSEDRKRYGLLLDQDVTANVMLSSLDRETRAGFVRDGDARRVATDMVRRLAIKTPSVRQRTKNLSGGNQQKVVLAKWLVRDCDVLIVDEPTRGIDVGAKEEIYELLRALADQGKSIVMISSELPEVLRLSERIVVMCEGRVTGVLDNADATQHNVMELATQFGGAEHLLATTGDAR
ncbi:D-xylose ABC transporter ATP-binding protein [Cellulosimicrobium cellulans]|uniref:D-xylose ABC transporter ATP-binding protein n=1 Tax=Cellulosimicrobium cellulans TaxID=1710 RepID=A0A1Y0HWF3_CELCE|nr:sugar ABC transporter ATP-binding protein [Cellulosimicrobium cellulans]ARU51625.1 D-xylose ABC transporter ATP-binding protein [Cellulosimicrobium cellulans]